VGDQPLTFHGRTCNIRLQETDFQEAPGIQSDTSSDNRRKAVLLFLVNLDKFLSNLHSLTALSRGGFSLDSIQAHFEGEAHGIHA
jgi:hypothetical protein